uniref:Uncharacterized protein n=1 Tax=Arundo donax TaxID=35708 RepID=A0A0A9AR59_ARUDO
MFLPCNQIINVSVQPRSKFQSGEIKHQNISKRTNLE